MVPIESQGLDPVAAAVATPAPFPAVYAGGASCDMATGAGAGAAGPTASQGDVWASAGAGSGAGVGTGATLGAGTAATFGGDFAAALLHASFSSFANGLVPLPAVGPGMGLAAARKLFSASPAFPATGANGFVTGALATRASKRLLLIAPSTPLACADTRFPLPCPCPGDSPTGALTAGGAWVANGFAGASERNGFDAGAGCKGADDTGGAGAAAIAEACIGDGVITGILTAAGVAAGTNPATGAGAAAGVDQLIEPNGSVLETCFARPPLVSAPKRSAIKSGAGDGAGASLGVSTAKGS